VTAPYWVKLVRTGSVVSGYSSPDGQNWTLVGSDFLPLSANVYVGLAVTAHNNSAVTTATFDKVAVTTQATYGNLAINSGGAGSGSFAPDADYTVGSGGTFATGAPIDTSGVSNPAPQAVYQTERFGDFTYTIPHLTPNSQYQVRLHFAEIYWTGPGQRQFNVDINGQRVLTNFDVFSAAGGANKAVVETFLAQSDAQGNIVIQYLTGSVDLPKSSGIEVLAASGGSTVQATGQAFQTTSGTSNTMVVASLTDTQAANVGTFIPMIHWGDGTTSAGTLQMNSHGGYDVVGTHTYVKKGFYTVATAIMDGADRYTVQVNSTAEID
jgi:hypothetical protein